ncbi:MAG TPA: hypothetical protein PKC76_05325 [Saprospiraceae bacterium]|nr:hypothetical protein [Saprospiraceae bacterium]
MTIITRSQACTGGFSRRPAATEVAGTTRVVAPAPARPSAKG